MSDIYAENHQNDPDNKPTADAAKLLPCPWCNSTPDQYAAKGEQVEATGYVWCANLQCVVQPKVQAPTLSDAITAWNTRPQPAPPEGEPDWEKIIEQAFFVLGIKTLTDIDIRAELVALARYSYGLAARPKVEGGEVATLCDELRRPSGIGEPSDHTAMSKAADLIERIAGERELLSRDRDNLWLNYQNLETAAADFLHRAEAAEAKLASGVAELAKVRGAASKLTLRIREIEANQSFQGIWSYLVAHNYKYNGPNWEEPLTALENEICPPSEAHAARQQQKASAEQTSSKAGETR